MRGTRARRRKYSYRGVTRTTHVAAQFIRRPSHLQRPDRAIGIVVYNRKRAEDNSGKRIPRREDLRRSGRVPEDRLDLQHGAVPGDVPALARRRRRLLGRSRPRRDSHWFKKWDSVQNHDFANAKIRWFEGGKLNVCLQLPRPPPRSRQGRQGRLLLRGRLPGVHPRPSPTSSSGKQVTKFANVLKKKGVKKGDRVVIYLPMIPELPIAMLACARIGAIHCVVFGGFSADALRDRILNAGATVMITGDTGLRGGKPDRRSRPTADAALAECPAVKTCIVVKHTGVEVPWTEGRDIWYRRRDGRRRHHHRLPAAKRWTRKIRSSSSTPPAPRASPRASCTPPAATCSTARMTHELIFDYHPEQVYWCTADIGWVTGHTYIVYGPLANGATSILFEGVPSYPTPDRFWTVVEKYKVNIFYTAPTALRAIAREGDDWVKKHDLSSLRVLGTVGEPINPEVWLWYHDLIGGGRCPIVDTWWQTETGGILITPLPGAMKIKPGSATLPFFGVEPVLVDEDGDEITGPGVGNLCMRRPWPGMMRGVYGDARALQGDLLRPVSRPTTSPATVAAAMKTATTGSPAAWTTSSTSPVTAWAPPRSSPPWSATPAVAEAAVVGMPHPHQGPGHLRLRHPERRRRAVGRPQEGTRQARPHRDRPDRHSGRHPVGSRSAEDPLAARSCAASSRRSRPTRSATWATPPPWPTRPWSTTWWSTARTSSSSEHSAERERGERSKTKRGGLRPPLFMSQGRRSEASEAKRRPEVERSKDSRVERSDDALHLQRGWRARQSEGDARPFRSGLRSSAAQNRRVLLPRRSEA